MINESLYEVAISFAEKKTHFPPCHPVNKILFLFKKQKLNFVLVFVWYHISSKKKTTITNVKHGVVNVKHASLNPLSLTNYSSSLYLHLNSSELIVYSFLYVKINFTHFTPHLIVMLKFLTTECITPYVTH